MQRSFYARAGFDNHFHIMRHIAAIAVVWTHSFDPHSASPLLTVFGRTVGHYAVDIFFIASGFVVMQSLMRHRDPLKFCVARFLRIFPGLLVAVLWSVLILGPLVSTVPLVEYFNSLDTWKYLIGATTTLAVNAPLPGVFVGVPEDGLVNVPLWTLKYEVTAYMLLVAAVCLAWRSRGVVIVAALVAAIVAYCWARQTTPWPMTEGAFSNLVHLLLAFSIGAGWFALKEHIRLNIWGVVILAAACWATSDLWVAELYQTLFIAFTVFWLAFYPTARSGQFQHMGDVSFGIYILAFPIQQTIMQTMPGFEPMQVFSTALFFTVPLAALSWVIVEKPAMARTDRLTTMLREDLPAGLQRHLPTVTALFKPQPETTNR